MRSRWVRVGQWLAGAAILWLAGRSLLRNWDQLRSQPLEWRIEPALLLLSALMLAWMLLLLVALGVLFVPGALWPLLAWSFV